MSDQYVGEIRLFGFRKAPDGWLQCNGQSLPISNYSVLFNLIGTTYGGDGVSSFNLPDLRGRVPIGQGTGNTLPPYALGQSGGVEEVNLRDAEMPSHGHSLTSTTAAGTTATPDQRMHLATATSGKLYAPVAGAAPYEVMAPCVSPTGQSLAHTNIMPTIVANFCIAFEGIYPSPS